MLDSMLVVVKLPHASCFLPGKSKVSTAAVGPKLHPHLRGPFTLAVASTLAVAAEHSTCSWLGTTATIPWLVLAALGRRLDRQASQEQQTDEHRDAHSAGGPTAR